MRGRLRDLGLALLIGVLAAGAGLGGYDLWRDQSTPGPAPVGDRVRHAAEALAAGDHVYVAADAHDLVPPELESRLEDLAADSDVPVFLAVWEASSQAGYAGVWDAVSQLQRLVDEQGVYVLYLGPGDGLVDDNLDEPLLGDLPSDFNGDPARRLEEIVTAVGRTRPGPASDWDYWGGPGGAVAAGALFASGAVAVILVLLGLARLAAGRRFRMVGGWR